MEHGLPAAMRLFLSMSRFVSSGSLARSASLAAIALVWALGCSSSSPPASCTTSGCPAGDACVDDGAGPACREACSQQGQCPLGFFCNDGQPQSWCVQSTLQLVRGEGQWGTPCSAAAGFDGNPACDTNDNFLCYGVAPTDATTFCTYYDCLYDSDCPGGWWCATIDDAPNVATASRTFGATRPVCLPRQYCAPCKMDHDCSPAEDGSQEHCVGATDATGATGAFCAPQCATSDDCPLDATCVIQWGVCADRRCASDGDCQTSGTAETCVAGVCAVTCATDADCPPSNGLPQRCAAGPAGGSCAPQSCLSDDDCPPTLDTFQHCNAGACTPECASDADCNPGVSDQTCVPLSVCAPRAGTCAGDGHFCSPCRSDLDCTEGYCLVSAYSKERFCSQTMPAGTACSATTGAPAGACPTGMGANYKAAACTSSPTDFAPANQCIGEVTFGVAAGQVQYQPGCWTLNR
jgi:hypothetical protein